MSFSSCALAFYYTDGHRSCSVAAVSRATRGDQSSEAVSSDAST